MSDIITEATVTPESAPVPVINDIVAVDKQEVKKPEITESSDYVDDTPKVQEEAVVKSAAKVVQEYPLNIESKWNEYDETVNMPSASKEDCLKAITDAPNIPLNDNEASRDWAETLNEGLNQAAFGDNYEGTLENPDAEFHQAVDSPEGKLHGSRPGFSPVSNQVLSGQRGILRMMAHKGMGTIFRTPLWHTGIWITFKSPSEVELLELHRQLISDKIALGRNTYGLALSSTSVYFADRLMSFALDHVYETSLEDAVDLKTVISVHDISAVLWGLANTIYPRGFQYRRSCVTNPQKCNHVIEDRLNLAKLLWTNTRAFTPSQLVHMTKRRAGSIKLADVDRYKQELLSGQKRLVEIDEGTGQEISMQFRIPTVSQYIDAGQEWISSIVSMVNRSLGIDATYQARNEYILKNGQATAMRQHLHWVENIQFDSNTIEDVETLRGVFDTLSSDDITRNDFTQKIQKYIDDTAIAVIGIPVYDCPKCGDTQPTGFPRQTSIIPIDIYQTFFTLLVQKLQRLTVR